MSKYQAYPEYQPVDIDWIDEIPAHWETSKMRYIFSFGKGLTITKEHLKDTGIPCVNYGEVHSKFGFEVDPQKHPLKCVEESYLKSGSSALLKKGDLVFADTSEDIDGSGNFTQLISDSSIFAGYHTIIARPHDRECSRFYAYLIDSKELRTQIRHAVKGVKVFSITQAILRSVNIWLPPFEEREKIAAFLDHETAKIDTLIEKQQQLIELLKEKRQAVISHAVTKGLNPDAPMKDSGVEWLGEVPEHWNLPKLIHITTNIGDGLHSTPKYQDNTGYFFVNGNNLVNGKITIGATAKEVPESEYHNHYIHLDSSTVFLSINGTIGNVAKYNNEQIILGKSAAYINCTDTISPDYLMLLLRTNEYRRYFDLEVTGTTISNLSLNSIRQMKVCTPTFEEQTEIVKYCHSNEHKYNLLIESAQNAINLMQERRTALISAAVTGKIDVRHFTLEDGVAPTTSSDTNEAQQEATA
ncbi:restriction endonuclease subunit S [Photobacterium toruni]|uniref:Restriction endonuclease subunit S n=1 Tax=Photobacterium toruni TaxID=1935446 RepID=A0ABU6LAC1_9GAMM|nr:restriction endonuclease subunit S [Photobacterium toruni]